MPLTAPQPPPCNESSANRFRLDLLSQIGNYQWADAAGPDAPLHVPPAFRPDGARWQFIRIRVLRICRQDTIDNSASTIAPLPAAALDATIGEPETLLGRATFVGELYEVVVDYSSLLQERHGPVRLHHPEENSAAVTGRTRAERLGRGARATGIR